MDFEIPEALVAEREAFRTFLHREVRPSLPEWTAALAIPRDFYRALGRSGWLGFTPTGADFARRCFVEKAVLLEELARLSPGVAVAVLVQTSLGLEPLDLFGSDALRGAYRARAAAGELLLCLGNTESAAGSDAAAIRMRADRVEGGWVLNGAKAFVTSAAAADFAVLTAVSEPEAARTGRISMFLVDLAAAGVSRTRLDKRVWIPSDLTRITCRDVFVAEDHLLGPRGRGLQQVLETFSRSRILIAAMTVGTAQAAFDLAWERAESRSLFGRRLIEWEAKGFEAAHHHARLEAARLATLRAAWAADGGGDFRCEASVAKYLAVEAAREVCPWAADVFGGASVVYDHPIHKFPMDAWASSLGEGTQDVQKLLIYRSLLERRRAAPGG